MARSLLELLRIDLEGSPILRANSLPTNEEVDQASREIGATFPAEYREFLLQLGGAMAGPFPIFGLRPVEVMGDDHWSVVDVTRRYRDDNPFVGTWAVISEDHCGNPVGMDTSGAIWIHDHDHGGVARLADDFGEYIRKICLRLDSNS